MRSKTSLGAFKERMAWTRKSITTVMSVYGVNHVLLKRNRNISRSRKKNLYKHLIVCSCIHVKCRHARNSNHLSQKVKYYSSNIPNFKSLSLMCQKKKEKQSKREEQKKLLVARKYYCNCYARRELRKCNIREIFRISKIYLLM